MQTIDGDEVLTVAEAAKVAGVRTQSIYEAIHKGRLPTWRSGPWMIRRSHLLAWMESRQQKKSPPG